MEQQTLGGSFTLAGVGIHTGVHGRVTVSPAAVDTGRVFVVDGVTIPARIEFVTDTSRCTRLGRAGASVSTVEHLLSALHAFGVDNARITVEGAEIPILDGSAAPFAAAVQSVEVRGQGTPAQALHLTDPLEWTERGTRFTAQPAASLHLRVRTEFEEWASGTAETQAEVTPATGERYAQGIAPARTFAFQREVEMLIQAGLAKGGSLDNALIITPPDGYSSPLRLPEEWCAHKMLDLIGDLALLDARLNMRLFALRPGHRANVAFATALRAKSQLRRDQENRMDCLLDIEEIRALLPHRYPMLLVDRVLELTPGQRVVGLKNVTINEPFFQGHFPAQAIMPGVLIVEAMAQVAGLMILALPEQQGQLAYLAALDNVKFRKPVVPGDTLIIEANLIKIRGTIGKVKMVSRVAGSIVAECIMTFAMKRPDTSSADKVLAKLNDPNAAPFSSDANLTDEGDSNRV